MTDKITDADLHEVLRMDLDGTAREWNACGTLISRRGSPCIASCGDRADAALVARYRNDYPAAARELLRLREGLAWLQSALTPPTVRMAGIVAAVDNLVEGRAWNDDGEVT